MKAVDNAVKDFNRYRIPEVEAEILEINEEGFKVKFKGTFCETCGFYDYFDDLKYILEDMFGQKSEITSIEEIPGGAKVEYRQT